MIEFDTGQAIEWLVEGVQKFFVSLEYNWFWSLVVLVAVAAILTRTLRRLFRRR